MQPDFATVRTSLFAAIARRFAVAAPATVEDAIEVIRSAATERQVERLSSVEFCLGDAASCLEKGLQSAAIGWTARALGHVGGRLDWRDVERDAQTLAVAGVNA